MKKMIFTGFEKIFFFFCYYSLIRRELVVSSIFQDLIPLTNVQRIFLKPSVVKTDYHVRVSIGIIFNLLW